MPTVFSTCKLRNSTLERKLCAARERSAARAMRDMLVVVGVLERPRFSLLVLCGGPCGKRVPIAAGLDCHWPTLPCQSEHTGYSLIGATVLCYATQDTVSNQLPDAPTRGRNIERAVLLPGYAVQWSRQERKSPMLQFQTVGVRNQIDVSADLCSAYRAAPAPGPLYGAQCLISSLSVDVVEHTVGT